MIASVQSSAVLAGQSGSVAVNGPTSMSATLAHGGTGPAILTGATYIGNPAGLELSAAGGYVEAQVVGAALDGHADPERVLPPPRFKVRLRIASS